MSAAVFSIDPSYSIGANFVNTTDPQTGRWRRIVILKNNSTFAALTAQNWTGNSIVGESLPAGFEISGVLTAFELGNSSAVIAYKI